MYNENDIIKLKFIHTKINTIYTIVKKYNRIEKQSAVLTNKNI